MAFVWWTLKSAQIIIIIIILIRLLKRLVFFYSVPCVNFDSRFLSLYLALATCIMSKSVTKVIKPCHISLGFVLFF